MAVLLVVWVRSHWVKVVLNSTRPAAYYLLSVVCPNLWLVAEGEKKNWNYERVGSLWAEGVSPSRASWALSWPQEGLADLELLLKVNTET